MTVMMYGKYNVETATKCQYDTVNDMHKRQTELEKTGFRQSLWRNINTLVEKHDSLALIYRCIWKVSDDEHVKQLLGIRAL